MPVEWNKGEEQPRETAPPPPPEEVRVTRTLGPAGWITIIVLLALLVAAFAYAVHAWSAMEGTQISVAGWVFMIMGAIFTIGLGGVLMGLVFYSSRKHYDQ